MLAFLRPLLSLLSSFASSPKQMNKHETFSTLLSPKLSSNTGKFLDVYRQGIAQSKHFDRISALTKFNVKSITGNKDTDTASEHELLSILVHDEVTEESHFFYIERNASSDSSGGPDSQVRFTAAASTPTTALLSAASTTIPTTLVTGASTSISTTADAASEFELPLLTSPTSPSSSNTPLLPLPPPLRPLSRCPSYHSIPEMLTLASARAVNSSAWLSSFGLAEDRISGSGRFAGGREIGKVVCQIAPVGLSLFELGILADVIHHDVPSYKLLQNQCYWFMLMVFEIVLRVYEILWILKAAQPPTNICLILVQSGQDS